MGIDMGALQDAYFTNRCQLSDFATFLDDQKFPLIIHRPPSDRREHGPQMPGGSH